MSRSDIADYLGLTIETVSRVLGQLRAREIIDVPTVGRIVFTDREALDDISAGE
jgi:CRP-like cAMP-binding protein